MQDHGKKYGWTISLYEYEATIPTLWQNTKGAFREFLLGPSWLATADTCCLRLRAAGASADFMDQHPEYVAEPNMLAWVSPDQGKSYNRCHMWYAPRPPFALQVPAFARYSRPDSHPRVQVQL